jgi:phage terminase small subunit
MAPSEDQSHATASAASLSMINPAGTRPRLRPPAELSELERQAFLAIVTSVESGHFRESDLPLLCAYCRAIIAECEAASELARSPVVDNEPSPWLRIHQAAVKTMMGLSMRLRLSPQSRQANNPTRPAPSVSYYERAALEGRRYESD